MGISVKVAHTVGNTCAGNHGNHGLETVLSRAYECHRVAQSCVQLAYKSWLCQTHNMVIGSTTIVNYCTADTYVKAGSRNQR